MKYQRDSINHWSVNRWKSPIEILLPFKRSVFLQDLGWVDITEYADEDVESEVVESVGEDFQSRKLDSASQEHFQSEDSASAGDDDEYLVI